MNHKIDDSQRDAVSRLLLKGEKKGRFYRKQVYLSQAALPDRLEVLLFVYLDFFRAVVVVN